MNRYGTCLAAIIFAVVGVLSPAAGVPVIPLGVERLPNGNTVISDGRIFIGNDAHVLEVDSLGRLVWTYIKCDVPFLHTARRLPNGNTLMTSSAGDRVVEVNPRGETEWSMSAGLKYPNDAFRLANGNTLITDRDNNRAIEVNPQCDIVWSYTSLEQPHNASPLPNRNILVCNGHNNQVLQVDSTGQVIWQHSTGLEWARCAQRLPNNNTLIADSYHNRVVEVTWTGAIAWEAGGLPTPYTAQRLANGNTVVSAGAQVLELTPDRDTVWRYPNTVPILVDTFTVVNPTSGCSLNVHIHRPAYAGPEWRVPGVIFAPDKNGFGSTLDSTSMPNDLALEGFAFMHFDPDGRGQSGEYPENYGGYVQQDGMHACLELLASRDYVDTSRLGVYARGYGITMGSGMIARHPEPRVKFLLDVEGPADRSQTCHEFGGHVPVPAVDDSFWEEREAVRFMKQVPSAYLRLQSRVDSNPLIPDNRHCIQLIDSATAVAYGGAGISLWTRVNDSVMNQPNKVYSVFSPPAWVPEIEEVQQYLRVIIYLHELADLVPPGVAELPEPTPAASVRAFPQPCRGLLRVEVPPGVAARQLHVRDVCGRLVASAVVPAGKVESELDLRNLRPGVYYVSAARAGTVPVVVVR